MLKKKKIEKARVQSLKGFFFLFLHVKKESLDIETFCSPSNNEKKEKEPNPKRLANNLNDIM